MKESQEKYLSAVRQNGWALHSSYREWRDQTRIRREGYVMITSPIMRYHGAKYRLAPWIMSFFPDHYTYVEPFGGAAGILLQKLRSMREVYNDLDGDIVNVFRVMQDKDLADELQRQLLVTPFARAEFNISYESTNDPVEQARRTLIRAHMGFGSAGATKNKTGFRTDNARHLWARYPDLITGFLDRLQGVLIENKPAIECIKNHDGPETLFFVDPPYVLSTRTGRYYVHELTNDDHVQLLEHLNQVTGMVVVSGYDSDIYNDLLRSWEKRSTSARISAGRGTAVRTECIWLNQNSANGQTQPSLAL